LKFYRKYKAYLDTAIRHLNRVCAIKLGKKDEKSVIFGANVIYDLNTPKVFNIRNIIQLDKNTSRGISK